MFSFQRNIFEKQANDLSNFAETRKCPGCIPKVTKKCKTEPVCDFAHFVEKFVKSFSKIEIT